MKKLTLAVMLLCAPSLYATPAFTFGACQNNGGTTSITFASVVIASGTAIAVGSGRSTSGASVVNSVTWNTSETLSSIGTASNSSSVNADLRWILAPTATTADIKVNLSSTNDTVSCYVKITNVATVGTAVASQSGSGTATNTNANTAVGQLVLDVVAIPGNAVGSAGGTGHTALGSANVSTNIATGMGQTTGAASVTMTWSANVGYAQVSASFASSSAIMPVLLTQYRRRR